MNRIKNLFQSIFGSQQAPGKAMDTANTAPLTEQQLQAIVSSQNVQFDLQQLVSAAGQSVGKQRELNEDSLLVITTTMAGLDLVTERVGCLRCQGGFLLDGFPRTVAQAEALEKLLKNERITLDAVLSYELPLERVVARLSGRRTCHSCKAVFHVETRPPKREGVCDHCGGTLYQREDDRSEAVRVRMEAYARSTAPLADFYRNQNLLVPVSAEGTPEQICERTLHALKARKTPRLTGARSESTGT